MNGMSVAGRRGELLWDAGGLTGLTAQRTYDTCGVRFGLGVPFALGDVYHIWDIPATKLAGPCKAVRLRPDPAFRRRVLTGTWVGLAAAAAGGGLFLLALAQFVKLNFGVAGAALAGSVAAAVAGFWLTRRPRDERRHRAIRLLLGFHEWGSSDPATWADELTEAVDDAKTATGCESFAAAAKRDTAAGKWAEAMWAARLCVAVDDPAAGEALTDAILAVPAVAERLRRVQRKPATRAEEFGDGPGLRRWVHGRPADHVLALG